MFIGGWLEKKIGPRLSTLIGSIGVLLSFFTIKVSFWLLLLTYGLVFGMGVGIAYVGPLSCAMRWMPKWKGVAGGFVVAGFGLGALVFDQVQSYYVNPHNIKTNEDGYFTDKELLDRVPYLFLVMGGTYAVMQLIGSLFIVNPPHNMETQPRKNKQRKQPHTDETKERKSDNSRDDDYFAAVSDGSVTPPTQEFLSDSETSSEVDVESDTPLIHHEPDVIFHTTSNNGINCQTTDKSKLLSPRNKSTGPDEGATPLSVLKSFNFYHLWVMFSLNGFAVSFISSLYKVFGFSFIKDDQYLAIVGSTSSILNCLGRIVWGLIADRFGFKLSLAIQSAIMTIFLLTFFATSYISAKVTFFIWVCVIFFCVGGNFSVFPTATALSFGPKYMSINYGLLFTSQIISGVIAAVLFTTLQNLLDWDGTIFLISGISLAGFFITLGFNYKKYF